MLRKSRRRPRQAPVRWGRNYDVRLGGRMKWPFGGNRAAVAVLEAEPEVEVVEDGKPHLMMLAADASGLASFKLLTFPSAETAIEYIQRSFGDRSDTGLIAFWGMTERPVVSPQPGAETALEVMVMVRDDLRNDVVYPFSFTDIETAHDFVKHELHRGLDPAHVLLYWAVPVQLGITADGEMGLFPKAAPRETDTAAHEITHAPIQEESADNGSSNDFMQSLTVSVAVDEPFVSTEDDPIETMFLSPDEPVAEQATEIVEVEDEIEEFAGGGDETHTEETAEVFAEEAEILIEETEIEEEPIAEPVIEEVFAEDEAEAQADVAFEDSDVEVLAETSDDSVSDEAVEDPDETTETTFEASAEPEVVEDVMEQVAAIASEQWVSDEPIGTEFPAGRAYARSESEINDTSEQLQSVLRVRRWEESTEPFRGFQSPPGRF